MKKIIAMSMSLIMMAGLVTGCSMVMPRYLLTKFV